MSERAVPYHCPFCGEEDLRPHEEPQGAWACMGCRRVFTVKFAGLHAPGAAADTITGVNA